MDIGTLACLGSLLLCGGVAVAGWTDCIGRMLGNSLSEYSDRIVGGLGIALMLVGAFVLLLTVIGCIFG